MTQDPHEHAQNRNTDWSADELLPLVALDEMLGEVLDLLDGVEDQVTAHRRACGDDHHALERLQYVQSRLGQGWSAVQLARKGLRP